MRGMRASVASALCATLLACAACTKANDGGGERGPDVFSQAAQQTPPEIATLSAALEANPQDPAAHRRLALALKDAMLPREALPHFIEATALDPQNKQYRLDLAAAQAAVGRFHEAEATYRELLEVPELRPMVLHNLGNLALRKDDLPTAIGYYEKALELRPDYLLARYHRGVALQQSGRLDQSYESFKSVLALPIPEDSTRSIYYDAIYRLGDLDLARGNLQRAAETLAQLLRQHPEHPNAWYSYGRTLMMLGREDEARAAFTRHMQLPDRQSGRVGYLGSPGAAERAAHEGGAPLLFRDSTSAAGIDYRNVCGAKKKNWITESLGAGAAWLDYDGDGVLDLYLANGSAHDRPANGGEPNRLYRGNGRGGFEDVTERAGLGHRGWGYGVAVGDIDNDGDPDLYVTNLAADVLYRNEGDGTFSDVTAAAGLGDASWGASAAFFDSENDGDLDLYVTNYLECDPATVPRPGESVLCGFKGVPTFCGPKPLVPQQDLLYRNDGDGTFTDVTREAGIWLDKPRYGLGVVTADYDNDGDQDVFVANDSVPNLLWQNRGDGTFIDVAVASMAAVGADGRAQSGMGTDFGDYNADGWLDLVVTTFSEDLNTIYRNGSGRYFVDESSALGMSVSYSTLSWGVGFYDFDNDAALDLFIANGHIYPEMEDSEFGTTYRQANHLFMNEGGVRFVDRAAQAGPGFEIQRSFRGAAFGDYDDDGDVDVLVTAVDDLALLLENESQTAGHWLEIALVGTRSNRDAVGARVTITARGRTQIRERMGGGSFLSSSDPRLHVGLGTAPAAERIEVRWPSGAQDVLTDVQADRRITIIESGEARR